MKKKMNAKEFWAMLEKAGYFKEIYGYEGVINEIAYGNGLSAKQLEQEGKYPALAKDNREKADSLHDALYDLGYYNY